MANIVIGPQVIRRTVCPFCNTVIRNVYDKGRQDFRMYCSCCGLPLHITPPTENFKYCIKCDALNSADANYCRCCGKDIRKDGEVYGKECGHGWMDLGLSVLWSTETLFPEFFQWMNSKSYFSTCNKTVTEADYRKGGNPYLDYKGNGKDVASAWWKGKWRTPTKEEFEELISRCTWEKIIIEGTDQHALKVTGPNGNHIIMKTTGYAGCARDENSDSAESIHSVCGFWTSTEAEPKYERKRAYLFSCCGYKNFSRTLTLKELEKKCSWMNGLRINGKLVFEHYPSRPSFADYDDRAEQEENRKKDMERRHALWLEEPIVSIHVWPASQADGRAIRPVMDKE